eukprot:TRINITY_DN37828_c0_g1_i1.p1 TRINITY_DN37828_c0_g1~~TRINITY_DN37828_c0_g1_i1.p1  ORF type:complete len:614 (-),score=119.80 TRINITY_DN37828_c0_g1_i1:38-1879(-)
MAGVSFERSRSRSLSDLVSCSGRSFDADGEGGGGSRADAAAIAWPTSPRPSLVADDAESAGRPVSSSSDCRSSSRPERRIETVSSSRTALAMMVKQSLCFEDAELFRGVPIDSVLHRCARVLDGRPCTAEHYELSAPVDHLDAFISHNWSTSRHEKFLALAMHFNLGIALASAALASTVAFALTAKGLLPLMDVVYDPDKGGTMQLGCWCQCIGITSFLLTLLFGREVLRLLGATGPKVFLDKVCVHQVDEEMKLKGIRSLAAFLYSSSNMVVLYSDVYLQKLWTVYELATFLLLFPSSRLYVQPVLLTKVVLMGMLTVCASRLAFAFYYFRIRRFIILDFHISQFTMGRLTTWMVPELAIFLPFLLLMVVVLRRWAAQRLKIYTQLRSFNIYQASCLNEQDRVVVERNVAVFATHLGFAEPGSREDEVLAAFNCLVRQKVPGVLTTTLGRNGVPYRCSVLMFMVYVFKFFDHWASMLVTDSVDLRTLLLSALEYSQIVFAAGPMTVSTCSWLCECSLKARGFQAVYRIFLVAFLTLLMYYSSWLLCESLVEFGKVSNYGVALFVAYGLVSFFVTFAFHRKPGGVSPSSHFVLPADSECSSDEEELDCSSLEG